MLGFQVSGFTIGAFSSRLLGVRRLAAGVRGFPTENLLTKLRGLHHKWLFSQHIVP